MNFTSKEILQHINGAGKKETQDQDQQHLRLEKATMREQMYLSTKTTWQVSLYSPACAEMLSKVMKFTAPL